MSNAKLDGNVYVVPNPAAQTWDVVVENTGKLPLGFTTNIFTNSLNSNLHDDLNYGHGLPSKPGTFATLTFHKGALYNGTPITEQSTLRLGVRSHCYKEMKLPPLDGAPVCLNLSDFSWYAGSKATGIDTTGSMASYMAGARAGAPTVDQKERNLPAHVREALKNTTRLVCEGTAAIEPVMNGTRLSHWEVKFTNGGERPWIGTVAFTNSAKNDGLGLESMACPNPKSSAMQRIESNGNYGVTARPGERIRMGVRGYGFIETTLPNVNEKRSFDLGDMTRDYSIATDDFFKRDLVMEKRAEKLAKVQFFENGVAVNGSLKPPVFIGAEGIAQADYIPPDLKLERTETGWRVGITSRLPSEDPTGKMGLVVTGRIERDGGAADTPLSLRKLEAPGEARPWEIPYDETAKRLIVSTRGLGWYAVVPLTDTIETPEVDVEVWRYRPDQVSRGHLDIAQVAKARETDLPKPEPVAPPAIEPGAPTPAAAPAHKPAVNAQVEAAVRRAHAARAQIEAERAAAQKAEREAPWWKKVARAIVGG